MGRCNFKCLQIISAFLAWLNTLVPALPHAFYVLLCSSPGFSRPQVFALLNHLIIWIFTLQARLGLIKFFSVVVIVLEQKVNACVQCDLFYLAFKIVLLFVEVAQSQRADFFFFAIHKNPCIRLRIDSSVCWRNVLLVSSLKLLRAVGV